MPPLHCLRPADRRRCHSFHSIIAESLLSLCCWTTISRERLQVLKGEHCSVVYRPSLLPPPPPSASRRRFRSRQTVLPKRNGTGQQVSYWHSIHKPLIAAKELEMICQGWGWVAGVVAARGERVSWRLVGNNRGHITDKDSARSTSSTSSKSTWSLR